MFCLVFDDLMLKTRKFNSSWTMVPTALNFTQNHKTRVLRRDILLLGVAFVVVSTFVWQICVHVYTLQPVDNIWCHFSDSIHLVLWGVCAWNPTCLCLFLPNSVIIFIITPGFFMLILKNNFRSLGLEGNCLQGPYYFVKLHFGWIVTFILTIWFLELM